MRFSRTSIAAAVTIAALGLLAAVALASGGTQTTTAPAPTARPIRRPRCGPRPSTGRCTAPHELARLRPATTGRSTRAQATPRAL